MNKGIKAAIAARRAITEQGGVIRQKDPIEKCKENPKSLRMAINAKCYDCCGGGADGPGTTKELIRTCPATECPLHHQRPYQRDKPYVQEV